MKMMEIKKINHFILQRGKRIREGEEKKSMTTEDEEIKKEMIVTEIKFIAKAINNK